MAIGPRNRDALERLCRYIARPPLAKSRLEECGDGTLRLHLKRPWSDGTVALSFTPAELVERLAALVPPPHKNQVLYHGVLAPRSAWRSLPGLRSTDEAASSRAATRHPQNPGGTRAGKSRTAREAGTSRELAETTGSVVGR